jgi:hypothetical protein
LIYKQDLFLFECLFLEKKQDKKAEKKYQFFRKFRAVPFTICSYHRDPNFREKLNAKAKRKRNFFRKKMRSESEANLLLLNAKKCEANPFQKNAKKMRKSYKKCENFAKILNEALRCIKARFLPKLRSAGYLT